MKKIFILMLVGVMMFSIAGCESRKEAKNKDIAGNINNEKSKESQKSDSKKYLIATDTTFAPFEFENEDGDRAGIDLDLLEAIAEDQGFEYELWPLSFSAAVAALESGECDGVIAGMSITEERQMKYDFSDPYFDSGVGMGVVEDSDIDSYDDLEGKTVAVKIGTEGYAFAEKMADKVGFTLIQFEDSLSMYQDVLAGNSVACFEDYPVMGFEITRGMELKMPLDMEVGHAYGFATLKGSEPELIQRFNDGLSNLRANGKYDKIINTYISK